MNTLAPAKGENGGTLEGGSGELELRPSAYLVMAMIRDGVDTGYSIKQRIERVASLFWSASYGQIYPELRRLQAAGLIEGTETRQGGRLRREYSLTKAGFEELRRWLESSFEPAMWLRNEGILRLMLVDWDREPELARKVLAELRETSARRLAAIESLDPPRDRGRRIQNLGERTLREMLRWCDETDAALAESGG